MPRSSFAQMPCSLARTLDVVGDTWTPLIVRDVFLGVDTFETIVRDLGVPRAVLAARLEKLVSEGVLERRKYQERPERFCYDLTRAGHALVPVLIALTQWGDAWRAADGPPIVFRHACGDLVRAEVTCASCRAGVTSESVTALPGPGGRVAAGTRVVAERLLENAAGEQGAVPS